MRERKPAWREVPPNVRALVEEWLGSLVVRSERVYGGYGPSVTLRVVGANGRRLFIKGAGPGSNEVNWATVPFERELYASGVLTDDAPGYLGAVEGPGWLLLLFEDLGHKGRVPPWTTKDAVAVLETLAHFHATVPPPAHLPPISTDLGGNWSRIRDDRALRMTFLTLAGDRDAAERWLAAALPALSAADAHILADEWPSGFLHADIRSDNLRLTGGRLVLFDWANASRGPLILDPVFPPEPRPRGRIRPGRDAGALPRGADSA